MLVGCSLADGDTSESSGVERSVLVACRSSKVVIRSIYGSPACGGIESVLLKVLESCLSRNARYFACTTIPRIFFYRSSPLRWG